MSSLKNGLPVESTPYWLSPVLQEEVLSCSGNKGCWQGKNKYKHSKRILGTKT